MKLKRPIFLISGTVIGTVGVLSYVPVAPTNGALLSLPPNGQGSASANPVSPTTANSQTSPQTSSAATTVAPTKTTAPIKTTTKTTAKKLSTKKSKTSNTTIKTPKATPVATPTATATPTPTPTPTQPSTTTRTIAGSTIQTPYGPVQVQITVQGTKIINAAALQIPQGGRSTWINNQAVPWLIQQTLAAQSANVQGVGGATITSQSWAQSLQAAISKV